ncbi:hypothetical protein BaRGS_00020464 [Batillaria attramentaria]|uniref:Uncharacterized protein n=1 Tax=Batillaria attramentaria TaxID=370345 RepID=A0ABD0KN56_9CAEN
MQTDYNSERAVRNLPAGGQLRFGGVRHLGSLSRVSSVVSVSRLPTTLLPIYRRFSLVGVLVNHRTLRSGQFIGGGHSKSVMRSVAFSEDSFYSVLRLL